MHREFAINPETDTIWVASYEEPTERIEFRQHTNNDMSSFKFENSLEQAGSAKAADAPLVDIFLPTRDAEKERMMDVKRIQDLEDFMVRWLYMWIILKLFFSF